MSRARPLVVEFVGLPASGKTTSVSQLAELLEADGLVVHRCRREYGSLRIWKKLRTVARFRKAVAVAALALLQDPRPIWQKTRAFRWVVATFECVATDAEQPEPAVVLIAEGVIQRSLLIFFPLVSPKTVSLLRRYLATIPTPDLVVHLDIDAETSAQRQSTRNQLGTRERTNRFLMPFPELTKVMGDAKEFLGMAIEQAAKARSLRVLSISPRDIDELKLSLQRTITPLIRQLTDIRQDRNS